MFDKLLRDHMTAHILRIFALNPFLVMKLTNNRQAVVSELSQLEPAVFDTLKSFLDVAVKDYYVGHHILGSPYRTTDFDECEGYSQTFLYPLGRLLLELYPRLRCSGHPLHYLCKGEFCEIMEAIQNSVGIMFNGKRNDADYVLSLITSGVYKSYIIDRDSKEVYLVSTENVVTNLTGDIIDREKARNPSSTIGVYYFNC